MSLIIYYDYFFNIVFDLLLILEHLLDDIYVYVYHILKI